MVKKKKVNYKSLVFCGGKVFLIKKKIEWMKLSSIKKPTWCVLLVYEKKKRTAYVIEQFHLKHPTFFLFFYYLLVILLTPIDQGVKRIERTCYTWLVVVNTRLVIADTSMSSSVVRVRFLLCVCVCIFGIDETHTRKKGGIWKDTFYIIAFFH